MRNLKRALALVMATAMLLGMMVTGTGAAYESFTDSDDIVNTEAVETMVTLGVINGRDDGSYDPTGIVTRGEMAKLIAVTLNGGSDPLLGSGASTTAFTDTAGHWAEAYIAYCANLGIINGYGDGTFGPDDTVTGTAASKMFLTALGYSSEIEGLTGTGWDLNTDILANKVGLYNELSTMSPSEGMTRDNVAQLIYNGVQACEVTYSNNYGEYSGYIYAIENTDSDGDPMDVLSSRFGVVKVEGVVVANEIFAIDTGVATLEGKTRLAFSSSLVDVYDEDGDYDYSYTSYSSATYPVSSDNELMGLTVVIYVKYENALSPNATYSTVVGSPVVSEKNTVVETNTRIADADALKALLKADGIATSSYTETVSVSADDLTIGFKADSNFYGNYNGQAQTFIDNDGDGLVDYAFQVTPLFTKVSSISSSNETITFATIGAIDEDDVISSSDLAKDDYVLVANYDDTYYVELAETVEGEVTAYNYNSKGALESVTLDGATYKWSASHGATTVSGLDSDTFDEMVGNEYLLYLDEYGYVVGVQIVSSTVGNYAVVLAAEVKDSLNSYTAQVKLFLEDGTTGIYDVNMVDSAKDFDIDGDTDTESANAMYKYIYENIQEGYVDDFNYVLVAYSIGDDGYVTIGNPEEMNTKYTLSTHDVDGIYSAKTSYATDDGTATANDSTIFFVNDGDDEFSVVIGVSNLPTGEYDVATGDYVSLYENSAGTIILEAMIADGGEDFYSSSSYAFVTGNYSKVSTTVYTYPVVLEDGTVTTLTTKDGDLSSNTIYSYYYDTNGYAVFESKYVDNSNVVTYISGSVVGYADNWNDATNGGSWTYSSADIWDVQDTDDVFETTLSLENAFAFAYDNDTKKMIVAFVYDEQDTMTEDFDVTISSDGTIGGFYDNQYVSAVKSADKSTSYTVYEDAYVAAANITAESYYWVTISEDGYEDRSHYVQADTAAGDDADADADADFAVTLLSVEYDGTNYTFTFDTDLDVAYKAGDIVSIKRGSTFLNDLEIGLDWVDGDVLKTSSIDSNKIIITYANGDTLEFGTNTELDAIYTLSLTTTDDDFTTEYEVVSATLTRGAKTVDMYVTSSLFTYTVATEEAADPADFEAGDVITLTVVSEDVEYTNIYTVPS